MKVTFARLRNGEWGARVEGGHAEAGDIVDIARRDGSTRRAELGPAVWSGTNDEGDIVTLHEIVRVIEN